MERLPYDLLSSEGLELKAFGALVLLNRFKILLLFTALFAHCGKQIWPLWVRYFNIIQLDRISSSFGYFAVQLSFLRTCF